MNASTQGYFDLQVNGYGGVDFNADDLTPEGLHSACAAMRRDGVDACLATVITEHLDIMCQRLSALVRLRERDELARQVIAGLHVEGPFINPASGFRGAHPPDAIRPADLESTRALLDAGQGLVRLLTLAPEQDAGSQVTRFLADQGVTVSAGHCDPTLEQLHAAIDAGLTMFTHLGNGCPPTLHRHDNIIQRAMSLGRQGRLWCCFIADGVHVPAFMLGNCLKTIGIERAIVVTDAVAPAGLGPGQYTLSRWQVKVGEDLVVRSPDGSHFVGSAVTMRRAEQVLREQVGLDDPTIARLIRSNPRAALRR